MKRDWVYVHTCNANGKRYVGITTASKPEYRWGRNGEGYRYNKHFYSAILKHGWDNFEHEVFEVDSAEEMYRKEVELISFYHSNDPEYGYNNSSGGEKSFLGCKHSEETRKRISETLKRKPRKPCSEETRKKISEAHRGKTMSEEARKKMSESHKGRSLSEEHRKHLAEAAKKVQKKVHSDPEYRKHISEGNKKRWTDPEYRRKQSEAAKNRPRVKIKLQDGTVIEVTKSNLARDYINKGRKFEYVS